MALKIKASKILIVDDDLPEQKASSFFKQELDNGATYSKTDSRGLSAFAVGSNQNIIGVDLEDFSEAGVSKRKTENFFRKALKREQLEKIAVKHFPFRLQDELQSLDEEQFVEQFFTHWVSLEALLKATGQGLANLDLISPALRAIMQKEKKWQGINFHLTIHKPFKKTVLALVQTENNPVHFYYENTR